MEVEGREIPIQLRELADEEGGGWYASLPDLGEATYNGAGDTPQEALARLRECVAMVTPLVEAAEARRA
jgi:predicted RNase H-like HicB family nuclease